MAKNSRVVGGLLFNINASTADFDSKMRQMQKKFDRLGKDTAKAGERMTKAFAPVTAVIATMSITGARYADAIDDASKNLQTSARALQVLRVAAKEGGTSTEKLETGMRQLVDNTVLAAQGNKELQAAIAAVGYTTAQFIALPVEKRIEALGIAYNKASDKATAHEAVMRLMGRKSGPELIQTLRAVGKEGFDALAERATNAGYVLSDNSTKKVADFVENLEKLKLRAVVAGAEISARLIKTWEEIDSKFGVSDKFESLMKWFDGLSDTTKNLALNFTLFAAASGPAVFVLGKLMSLYSPLISIIGKTRVVLSALTATTVADTAATTANTAAKIANANASGLSMAKVGKLGAQAATVAATAFFTYEATKGITEAIISELENSSNKQKQIAQSLDEQAVALEAQFEQMKSVSDLLEMRQKLSDQYDKTVDAWVASSGKERDQLSFTLDVLQKKRLVLISHGSEIVKQNSHLERAAELEKRRNNIIAERDAAYKAQQSAQIKFLSESGDEIRKKYLENKFTLADPSAQLDSLRAQINEKSGGLGSARAFEQASRQRINAIPLGLSRSYELAKAAETYNEIVELEKRHREISEQISEENKKQVDLAEEAAKKLKAQQDAIFQMAGEYEAMRLRANGKDSLASAVEAELKLREQIADLMEKTGVSEAQAEKALREKLKLENAIAATKDGARERETNAQRAERMRKEREEKRAAKKAADPVINLGDGTKKRWTAMDSGERDKALERYRQGYAPDGSIRPDVQAKSLVDSLKPNGSKGAQAAALNPRVSSGAKSAEAAQASANMPKENNHAGQGGGVEGLLVQLLGKFDTFTSQFAQAFST